MKFFANKKRISVRLCCCRGVFSLSVLFLLLFAFLLLLASLLYAVGPAIVGVLALVCDSVVVDFPAFAASLLVLPSLLLLCLCCGWLPCCCSPAYLYVTSALLLPFSFFALAIFDLAACLAPFSYHHSCCCWFPVCGWCLFHCWRPKHCFRLGTLAQARFLPTSIRVSSLNIWQRQFLSYYMC
jgi:hypothetical protein